eukprot:gene16591-biopygen8546
MSPGGIHVAFLPRLDAMVDLQAQLHSRNRQHHLPQAGHDKGRHVQHIQANTQPMFVAFLGSLAIRLGGGYGERSGVIFQALQVVVIERSEQLATDQAFAARQVDVRVVDLLHVASGVPLEGKELGLQSLQESRGFVLRHQAGKQPLILRGAQVDRQFRLERLYRRVFLERAQRRTGDPRHQPLVGRGRHQQFPERGAGHQHSAPAQRLPGICHRADARPDQYDFTHLAAENRQLAAGNGLAIQLRPFGTGQQGVEHGIGTVADFVLHPRRVQPDGQQFLVRLDHLLAHHGLGARPLEHLLQMRLVLPAQVQRAAERGKLVRGDGELFAVAIAGPA